MPRPEIAPSPPARPRRPAATARALAALAALASAPPAPGQEAVVIEAEDFNFGAGQFIDNPSLEPGPTSYAGKGADSGAPGIDFREDRPLDRAGDGYRTPLPSSGGLPQTRATADTVRPAFADAGVSDFELTGVLAGEWVNYTRTFPAGEYLVSARVRTAGANAFFARLEKVTSDPSSPGQSRTAVGVFLGRNATADYGMLPLTDAGGNPVTVALDGVETLRLAVQVAAFDLNYLEFTPTETAARMPSINIVAPAHGSGVAPGSDLEVRAETPGAPTVAQVQFLALTDNGDGVPIGETGGPPFTFTWPAVTEGRHRIVAAGADDGGLIGISSEVAVYADNTPPELVSARGRTVDDVLLTFSEAMDPATAGDPGNYTIVADGGAALAVAGVAVTIDGTVTVFTETQEVGQSYTLTLDGLTDLAGNPLPAPAEATFFGNGPLLQTDLGFVVFEAEHYDRNPDELWVEDRDRGTPSGGASMHIPNGAGGSEAETQLQYDIKFVQTGTHYFWYRASSDPGGMDDSAWLWVDGARPAGRETGNLASMSGFNGAVEFEWNSSPQDGGGLMSFEIDQPGVHEIAIAQREDGAYFDKFVITTDSNFNPEDFGAFGPPLTPREGEMTQSGEAQITLDPVDVTGVEHGTISLRAEGSVTEGFFIVRQWQREVDGVFEDIPGETGEDLVILSASLDWDGAVVRFTVSTEGATAASSPATITVLPDRVPPAPQVVSGRGTRAALQFSEPVDAAAAADTANYTLTGDGQGLAILGATLLSNGITVLLDTDPQTPGVKYTLTITGVPDRARTPNVLTAGEARFYSLGDLLPQGDDGLIVFEAESFTDNTDGRWIEDSTRGNPSGGVAMVLPNGAGGGEASSRLLYELTFTQTGEHIIWYRASAPSGSDDSAWFHLDGARPPNRLDGNQASMTGFSESADYVWRSAPQDGGGQMTFPIDEAGVHEIGVARREDGAYFDKFVITTDPGFDPTSFGVFGPPETRGGQPPLPTFSIAGPGAAPAGEAIELTADISATDRVVVGVEYFANGQSIGEATEAPFAFTWDPPPPGFYIVTAILTDDVGASVSAGEFSIFVQGEVVGEGRNVVWVSQVESDAGAEFFQLLREAGHTVTELYLSDPTAAEVSVLNSADVVVVGRRANSTDFNVETWDTAVQSPLILMSPYLSRAIRWGWFSGDGVPDDTPAEIMVEALDHPVFEGLETAGGTTGPWHFAVDRGTTLAGGLDANGGSVIASAGGNMVVVEWPAGAVAAGPRMLFAAGSREAAGNDLSTAGKYNLTADGARAFLNAIEHMAGQRIPVAVPFTSIGFTAPGVLTIGLAEGEVYDIEHSPSLAPATWTIIGTDVSGVFEESDPGRLGAPAGFYRGVPK